MKKLFLTVLSLALTLAAFAQTPQEIISRMEQRMSSYNYEKEGLSMIMDLKLPILGTFSAKVDTRGDKTRMEMKKGDAHTITWRDKNTEWEYNVTKNEIEIKNIDPKKESKNEGDVEMFKGITEGYTVTISKETENLWYLKCKKSRSNNKEDDPKTMDLVVEKGTYNPKSLSAKLRGVTLTMRDLTYSVSEKQVTFNQADYPGVSILDKR